MMRDSLVFYRSFYEAIEELPRDIQSEIYTAIMEYGLNGMETDNLKPVARSLFKLIKPQLDINNQRYENGKNGGRQPQSGTKAEPKPNQRGTKEEPKRNQSRTKAEPNPNQSGTKPEPNDNVNVNVNVLSPKVDNKKISTKVDTKKVDDEINSGESKSVKVEVPKPTTPIAPSRKSIPPTLEMVKAYCTERGNNVDAERFIDHYTSIDWVVGRTRMKDWEASVRTWEHNDNAKRSDTNDKSWKNKLIESALNECNEL